MGSAAPPGCPETNWQLETALATRKSRQKQAIETKRKEQERGKREGKKRNKTQQHPQREGRLSKVWPTVM